jgi:single-strand DNA-binding protein
MASLNSVQLVGRLGKTPELKNTPNAGTLTTFTVATNERWRSNEETKVHTEWHNIEVWGPQAKACAQYLDKGRLVMVIGALRTDRWEKDGQPHSRTKVLAQRVLFLDGPERETAEEASEQASADA